MKTCCICCILNKQAWWIYTSFILWWLSFLCAPVDSWSLAWSTSARWNSWWGLGFEVVEWWSDLLLSCWRYESRSNDWLWQLLGKCILSAVKIKNLIPTTSGDSFGPSLSLVLGKLRSDQRRLAAAHIVSPSSWRWLSLLSGIYRCYHWFSLLQRCHENTLQMECQGAATGNSWCITSLHRLKWWHLCKNIESENKKVQKYLMAESFTQLWRTITDNSRLLSMTTTGRRVRDRQHEGARGWTRVRSRIG